MEKVNRLNRELRAQGAIIGLYKDTVEINGITAEWDYIHHDGGACVVAVNDEGKIVLVRQYRNAIDDYSLELPAGKLDAKDEPTIACAKRELLEETGYRCETMEQLVTIHSLVAFCDEKIDIFLATDLRKECQKLDAEESIEVEWYSLEELKQMIFAGKITDAKTVAGIMAYAAK